MTVESPCHPIDDPARRWALDERGGALIAPNGLTIRLSLQELQLLRLLLLEKPGDICTHAELALALGKSGEGSGKHRLEVIFSRLRERTHRLSGCPLPLRAERGVGYRMSLASERILADPERGVS